MILQSFKYIRESGKHNEWTLADKDEKSIIFGNTNLVVGKNAVGKSRSLALIEEIANILSLRKKIEDIKAENWECDLSLKEGDDLYRYQLVVENMLVSQEIVIVNGIEKYNRSKNRIYSEQISEFIKIDIANDCVATTLHEEVKYLYLTKLFTWGKALKRFAFTNQLDKNRLISKADLDLSDTINPENTIQLFYGGSELFGDSFTDSIISDMKHINYCVSDISLMQTENTDYIGISVLEDDLFEPTLQTDMSQGMFRALSLIINLNFALYSRKSICLLIDDLGEGLDYSRSKSLIDLLIKKINNSNIQLFITTNDRYVINTIPIKYWSIIERKPKASLFYNYYNSKEIFEDFKYTGLSNFDFLATNFYRTGFENDKEEEEFIL